MINITPSLTKAFKMINREEPENRILTDYSGHCQLRYNFKKLDQT